MILKQQRRDLKHLAVAATHRCVDKKGCVTCQELERVRHMILMAEELLDPNGDYNKRINRAMKVLKDAGK